MGKNKPHELGEKITGPAISIHKIIWASPPCGLKPIIAGAPKNETLKPDEIIDLSAFIQRPLSEPSVEWCKCKDSAAEDAIFYEDGAHPKMHKHHWRCNTCNGIIQIG